MTGQIEAAQLTRRAFVYVRQSSLAQVLHHHESTMMQCWCSLLVVIHLGRGPRLAVQGTG